MFHIIPDNFFVPLSSPNRDMYWECIMILYNMVRNEVYFGIEKTLAADRLQMYFDDITNTSPFLEEDEELATSDSRGRATTVLRNLEEYGWIETDYDRNSVRRVHFRDHAVRIIVSITEIESAKEIEYEGVVGNIYALTLPDAEVLGPWSTVSQMAERTDVFINALRRLNTNIKDYVERLQKDKKKTADGVLDMLFNDYIENVVSKEYHILKTSQNVSMVRPSILKFVRSKMADDAFITSAAQEGIEKKHLPDNTTLPEGKEVIRERLNNIFNAFDGLDSIMKEIDERNHRYITSSISMVQFLLRDTNDIQGQLREILMDLTKPIREGRAKLTDPCDAEDDLLDHLITMQSFRILDVNSLRTPRSPARDFKPARIAKRERNPKREEEALHEMQETLQMQAQISPKNIEKYVMDQLNDRDWMYAEDLPLNTQRDLTRLLYVRIYGDYTYIRYNVELQGRSTEKNGFVFPCFIIRKAG